MIRESHRREVTRQEFGQGAKFASSRSVHAFAIPQEVMVEKADAPVKCNTDTDSRFWRDSNQVGRHEMISDDGRMVGTTKARVTCCVLTDLGAPEPS